MNLRFKAAPRLWGHLFCVCLPAIGVLGALSGSTAQAASTTLVSVATDGTQINADVSSSRFSSDGKKIVFASAATNLVPNDTNGKTDVFVRDLTTGVTSLVSVATDGSSVGNNYSESPCISGDGNVVAFVSAASNLVAGDTSSSDVFVRDLTTGVTIIGNLATDGTKANSISNHPALNYDGKVLAFQSLATNFAANDTNRDYDIFVRDLTAGVTTLVSVTLDGGVSSSYSYAPSLSGDGKKVTFFSGASNLVTGDTNGADIFLRDLTTNTTTRVSVSSSGAQGNQSLTYPAPISRDGSKVLFSSQASNMVPNDTNNEYDVFLRDLSTNTTTRVSVASDGTQGDDQSNSGSLSDDGTIVTFSSYATTIVPNDTNGKSDVFVRDLTTNTTKAISVDSSSPPTGALGNGGSFAAGLSADGTKVLFRSTATNLVANDSNGFADLFVRDITPPSVPTLSVQTGAPQREGTIGNGGTLSFTVSLFPLSGQGVTVNYSTENNTAHAGSDYTAKSGTLTFVPGESTKTVIVNLLGDSLNEADETFYLDLSAPSGAVIAAGGARATGTIRDNQAPTLAVSNVAQNEGDTSGSLFNFTVTLSAASLYDVTVTYYTTNGSAVRLSDFSSANGTLTIPAGQTNATIAVTVWGDKHLEADETFFMNLINPTNATIADAQGVGTILNDDGNPSLSINDISITESNGGSTQASFSVMLSALTIKPVTFSLRTASAGSPEAAPGADYTAVTSRTVTIPAGQSFIDVPLTVLGDAIDEADEKFSVILYGAVNATISDGTGLCTIVDNDNPPAVSINATTATEGSGSDSVMTFTLSLTAPSAKNISVQCRTIVPPTSPPSPVTSAIAGTDYMVLPTTTVIFKAGETSKTVSVTIKGDLIDEDNERVMLQATNPVNANLYNSRVINGVLCTTGDGTIVDDDAAPSLSINDVSLAEGNSGIRQAAFTITLSAPSGRTVTVYANTGGSNPYATPGEDYVQLPTTQISFSPGQTSKTVNITTNGDTKVEQNEKFTVLLNGASYATISDNAGIGTILNDDSAPSTAPIATSDSKGSTHTEPSD